MPLQKNIYIFTPKVKEKIELLTKVFLVILFFSI